jgi:hemerythrin superfamily protein
VSGRVRVDTLREGWWDEVGLIRVAGISITSIGSKSMANTNAPASAGEQDAIALLKSDHMQVKALFSEFDNLKDDGAEEDKAAIVAQICNELKIHTAIEEEIFYPAVRKAIEDSELMDEALVEHAGAKELIAQLEGAAADDDLYNAKVTVLGEQIEHHVQDEEGSMFPKAKTAKVDTAALGAKMIKRKMALLAEMGGPGGDAVQQDEEENSTSKKKKTAER